MMRRRLISFATCLALGIACTSAHAEGIAGALRIGTLGVGVDVDFKLSEQLNLRVGYAAFNYDYTLNSTDVHYDGTANLRNATALLDWFPGNSGFRVSFGLMATNTHVDATGKPTNGTFEFNDQTFTASQVGSVKGTIEPGNSFGPYVGLGWGNPVGSSGRVTFLADVGLVYLGTPSVNLEATCGPAAPSNSVQCVELQNAVAQEERDLQDDANIYEWYPVASVGLAIKF
jgi:hypothetical protein